ncbi:MAG TPA: GNAT family N-acetyltransferase [Coxiellaceae bacterium]|nr:GNAT family N-acetyltransferase [Coxiellaceae bacterium]
MLKQFLMFNFVMAKPHFRFNFKPVAESQRELIHAWLKQDYMQEWIHGQGLKNTLMGLEKFLKSENLTDQSQLTRHWLGYEDDKAFVYLLTTLVVKDSSNEYAKLSDQDGLAITLDIFIGDPHYLGKGLAGSVIKEFLLSQFSHVTEVFIDPEKTNGRAIHVYQKVGFRIVGEFIAPWHPVPHYIMKINMKDLRVG